MKIFCNLLKLVLSIIILVFLILILTTKETFKSFPESEAKYYKEKENSFGIPKCHYGKYTPILTCSYESRV